MRSDFEPIKLKEAKKKLTKHLFAVEMLINKNRVYKEKAMKEEIIEETSLWQKILGIFKKRR